MNTQAISTEEISHQKNQTGFQKTDDALCAQKGACLPSPGSQYPLLTSSFLST